MSFVVLNVLKSSIEQQVPTCTGSPYLSNILSKTEEVEMAINISNINFCESSGKNTSRITMKDGVNLDVLCPFEDLLGKINPSMHQ